MSMQGKRVLPEDRRLVQTEWSGMDDWDNAPPDYETFVAQYYEYTRGRCINFGVLPEYLLDVVQHVIMKFIETDSLAEFDPSFYAAKADSYNVKFRTFYTNFVLVWCKNQKRKNALKYHREKAVLDAPIEALRPSSGFAPGTVTTDKTRSEYIIPRFFGFSRPTDSPRLETMIDYLLEQCDTTHASAMKIILTLALSEGKINESELARQLGTTSYYARRELNYVRDIARNLFLDR
jgi:hypothetical protein